MLTVLILLFATVSMLAVIDTLYYFLNRRRMMGPFTLICVEIIAIIIEPAIFMGIEGDAINDCCSGSAFFSPAHRLSIYVLIILAGASYFFSSWRTKLSSPLFELVVNCFLLMGLALNILMALHESEGLWLLGNVPIIALFMTILFKNHQILFSETVSWTNETKNPIARVCIRILKTNAFIKYPVLLIICFPLIFFLSVLLYVFGQRPDSAIRAFTETYKHGLSEWDYQCENIECGEHYLCSIAANGHPRIVRPVRYGERQGGKIICNRQLLISNAFEELVEEKFPAIHQVIRRNYDHIGDIVHKHYHVFDNKIFSDIIYILMKPLEWVFLVTLYLFDSNPENRISQQYIPKADRIFIKKILASKYKIYSNDINP